MLFLPLAPEIQSQGWGQLSIGKREFIPDPGILHGTDKTAITNGVGSYFVIWRFREDYAE